MKLRNDPVFLLDLSKTARAWAFGLAMLASGLILGGYVSGVGAVVPSVVLFVVSLMARHRYRNVI